MSTVLLHSEPDAELLTKFAFVPTRGLGENVAVLVVLVSARLPLSM